MSLFKELRSKISGELLEDDVSRGVYSTDASMFQITPVAVLTPKDAQDVVAAVNFCRSNRVPIVPRGGGTSLAGQAVGEALIIDCSRHMNAILEIDSSRRIARVQPGVLRDQLNAALKPHGLHFAPDPATADRATIGGMIATNSAGMRSVRYGMTIDHVETVTMVLADGETIKLGTGLPAAPHPLTDRLRTLLTPLRDEILRRFPKVARRSGGYALDAFTGPQPWNFAKMVAGSEGTLGIVVEAEVNLEPLPCQSRVLLAMYRELDGCLRSIEGLVDLRPSAVELMDENVIRQARQNRLTAEICRIVPGDPAAVLVIEVTGNDPSEVESRAEEMQRRVMESGAASDCLLCRDAAQAKAVWEMRNAALGLLSNIQGARKPVPYIEDAAVPLPCLASYIAEVLAVCRRHEQPVALFAHAGVGLLHVRPMHDLHQPEELAKMRRIQREVFELVRRHGGSWSGEHGDGLIRGMYNREFFGDRLYEAFQQVKRLFDPPGLMNPGKIVETPPEWTGTRYSGGYRPEKVETIFRFREHGDVLGEVEACNGVGACRKLGSGTMCPSYMATRDERHSTRGRANALRLAITNQIGEEGWFREEVHDALDLCLGCKACKKECPNAVDVSRLKAEVWNAAGYGSRLFGRIDEYAPLASAFSGVVNALGRSGLARFFLRKFAGLDPTRPLPVFARERFSNWAARQKPAGQGTGVFLFIDTWTEFFEPEVGRAAFEVLTAAGYCVHTRWLGDSQRAAISQGMLFRARFQGSLLMRELAAEAAAGRPVLVLEPSCASSLKDDLPDLVPNMEEATRAAAAVRLADEFLAGEVRAGRARLQLGGGDAPLELLHHGHCHQKALFRDADSLDLLRQLPNVLLRDSAAGCCGMAGSFGCVESHRDLSRAIFADRLQPAIEKGGPDQVVVCNGFSCRSQVRELSGRTSLHALQVVRRMLR